MASGGTIVTPMKMEYELQSENNQPIDNINLKDDMKLAVMMIL